MARKNNLLLWSFFLLLIVTEFDLIFEENIPIPDVYSFLKAFDEVYVVLLFLYTICKKRGVLKNIIVLKVVLLFSVIGLIGNIFHHTSVIVAMMGLYTTIKPILLFWTLCQYDFEWNEFLHFLRLFGLLFPLIVLSYVCDIFIPSFRSDIGIVSQAVDIRMGMRSLGGLFNRFTNGILFALVYYVGYGFYLNAARWKCFFAAFMIVASLKVKDIAGFCFGNLFLFFHRFKKKNVIVVAAVLVALFNIYAVVMPDHYAHYFESGDDSNVARVVLNRTSIMILKDCFPFGVGHGMFASPISRQQKSPVYSEYHIDNVYGLNFQRDGGVFMTDTFWPMILGETGFLGTLCYILILYIVFMPFIKGFFKNTRDRRYIFPAFLFFVFLMTSLGKPVFNGPPHCFVLWGIAGIFHSLSAKVYEKN